MTITNYEQALTKWKSGEKTLFATPFLIMIIINCFQNIFNISSTFIYSLHKMQIILVDGH